MQSRPLQQEDALAVWEINEEGLPGTGKVTVEEISYLIEISEISIGIFVQDVLVGFVICLSPKLDYGSLNYAWFNEKYDDFIYVDRIAVSTKHRGRGIGSSIYQELFKISKQKRIPIAAEVNSDPPNPGSIKFHQRLNFLEVGSLKHDEKSVIMFLRKFQS